MSDDTTDSPRLDLSATQVAGSALAAVSAAVFGSWLGTAGTLIGAAVGSVIGTVGATTYTWWLRRTGDAVRRRAVQVRESGLHGTVVLPRFGEADRDPELPGEETAPEESAEPAKDRWAFARGRPWGKVLLASVGVMLASLAAITAFESVTGRPISSLVGGDEGSGTTVGHVVGTDERTPTPTPTPTPEPSPSQAPTQEPTQTPTPSPSTDPLPSEAPVPTPTDEPEPTEAPSTDPAPTPTP